MEQTKVEEVILSKLQTLNEKLKSTDNIGISLTLEELTDIGRLSKNPEIKVISLVLTWALWSFDNAVKSESAAVMMAKQDILESGVKSFKADLTALIDELIKGIEKEDWARVFNILGKIVMVSEELAKLTSAIRKFAPPLPTAEG